MPPIFRLIQETGDIPERDMYNTFNMGVGHVHRGCRRKMQSEALDAAGIRSGERPYRIGEVMSGGEKGVELW